MQLGRHERFDFVKWRWRVIEYAGSCDMHVDNPVFDMQELGI